MTKANETTTDPALLKMITTSAENAVEVARTHFSAKLDYSFASLETLEQILVKHQGDFPKGWRRLFHRAPNPIKVAQRANLWGAYFGETLRKSFGGTWGKTGSGPLKRAYVLTIGNEQLTPMTKVLKRMLSGDADNVWTYATALKNKITGQP